MACKRMHKNIWSSSNFYNSVAFQHVFFAFIHNCEVNISFLISKSVILLLKTFYFWPFSPNLFAFMLEDFLNWSLLKLWLYFWSCLHWGKRMLNCRVTLRVKSFWNGPHLKSKRLRGWNLRVKSLRTRLKSWRSRGY